MKKSLLLSVILIFLLAFTFQSCNDNPTEPKTKTVVSILSPSTNSIASDTTTIKIQILGNDNIVRLELYINHHLYSVSTTKKSYYEFKWYTRNIPDGNQILLNAIAYDSNGNSFKSKFSIVYVYRFMPVNLKAGFVNDSTIQLSWLDFSKIETGFKIYEAVNDSNFSLLAQIDSNKTSYIVNTPYDTSKSYYFRMRAFNLKSLSNYTPIVKAKIELFAPTNVHGSFVSDSLLTLSWDDNNSFEEMFVINMNGGTIATTEKSQTTIKISKKFYSNTIYAFKVYAYSKGFFSKPSSVLYLNFKIAPPVNLHVYNNRRDAINLTWKTTSQYTVRTIIERKSDFNPFTIVKETSNNDTTFTDVNLDNTKTYFYRIKSVTNLNQSYYSNKIEVGYSLNMKVSETKSTQLNLSSASFSGNYKYFFKRGQNIRMYDVKNLSFLKTFEAPTDTQNTNSSPNILVNFDGSIVIEYFFGNLLFVPSRIAVWDSQTGHLTKYFYKRYDEIGTPFSITSDNQKLLSFDAPNIDVFSLESGSSLSTITGMDSINSLYANPNSNQFFILRNSGLDVFNMDTQVLINTINTGSANKLLTTSKNGVIAVTLENYSRIKLWNTNTGELLFTTILNNGAGVATATISKDNKYLFVATNSRNSQILTYDITIQKQVNAINVDKRVVHLSAINGPFEFISITRNERTYWTFEKAWMQFN